MNSANQLSTPSSSVRAGSRLQAFLGALAGDALSMPGHWYYNRLALRRDYGRLDHYIAPKNPHPDSILWRSVYEPLNPEADILREQAQYWGVKGVHYHQFLGAGENTLNYRLAVELFLQVREAGAYDADRWLQRYIALMRTPGWHRDTYVEEYHRNFFTNLARGRKPRACGVEDVHIGGLVPVAALWAALPHLSVEELRPIVREHVALTHRFQEVLAAADSMLRILGAVEAGESLARAIIAQGNDWFSERKAAVWMLEPDETVVGARLSPACYIEDAYPASLHLAWKYAGDFSAGVIANANVGGDNCHRASVVGALLAAESGVPDRWKSGLGAADLLLASGE